VAFLVYPSSAYQPYSDNNEVTLSPSYWRTMIRIIQKPYENIQCCHAIVTKARHTDPAACNVMSGFYSIPAGSVTLIVLLSQFAGRSKVSLVVFAAFFVGICTPSLLPFTQVLSKFALVVTVLVCIWEIPIRISDGISSFLSENFCVFLIVYSGVSTPRPPPPQF
jgi:hypothetical protein